MRVAAVVLLALAAVCSAQQYRPSYGSYSSYRPTYGASGSQVGLAPGRHGSSQLLQQQQYGSGGRQVYGLQRAQAFRPQSSYGAPAHRPQSSYVAPVHRQQSSYVAPVHQQQSSYVAPVHQQQSSYVAPVHQQQSSYVAPAHQLQTSYAAPSQGKYFFSWRAPDLNLSDKYTWQEADYQCTSRGYKLVSLDQPDKDSYVSAQVAAGDISYIWTSGVRTYSGFVWGNGSPVAGYTHWSSKGGDGRPQPDNRERPENCLAVLNNIYDDGVIWHDINCERKKHFVCEIY